MSTVELGREPTTPPPDPNKPYLWTGDEWVLVATDTSDKVPPNLDHLDRKQEGRS